MKLHTGTLQNLDKEIKMHSMLDAGGVIFWGAIAVVTLFDFLTVAVDDDFFYGWSFALTVPVAIYVISRYPGNLLDQLTLLVTCAVGYLILGIAWSFKKWRDLVKRQRNDARAMFGETYQSKVKPPKAANYSVRITGWITFWPWSFVWWVMTWPRHAAIWAYNQLSAQFDAISERMWQ